MDIGSFQSSRPNRVLLLGCGAVGAELVKLLRAEERNYQIVGVFVRDWNKYRLLSVNLPVTDDPRALHELEPDLIIDVTAGAGYPEVIQQSLARRVHVISANTRAVAHDLHGALHATALSGARFKYGACVDGSMDILSFIERARSKSPIQTIHMTSSGVASAVLYGLSRGSSWKGAQAWVRDQGVRYACQIDALRSERQRASMDLVSFAAFGETLPNLYPTIDTIEDDTCVRPLKESGRYHPVMTLERVNGTIGAEARILAEPPHLELAASFNGQFGIVIHTEDGNIHTTKGPGIGPKLVARTVMADINSER